MKKPKQLQLFKSDLKFFGGRLLHGKRRNSRPLSTKEPIHLVMRSSWAKGASSFLQKRHKNEIKRLIRSLSKKYLITLYQVAIVSNHLHLVVKISSRRNFKTFLRVLASQVASQVMGRQSFKVFKSLAIKQQRGDGHPGATELQGLEQQFWQFRPWSRVLSWGRDFKTCCAYVMQNSLEALGFAPYIPRKNRYSKWIMEATPLLGFEPSS